MGAGSGPPSRSLRHGLRRLTKALHPVSLVRSSGNGAFACQGLPTDPPGADDKLAQDGPAARRSRDARHPQRRHLGVLVVGRPLESAGRGRQGEARRPQPSVGSDGRAVQPGPGAPAADPGEAPRRETGQGRRRRHHRPSHLRAVQARGRGVHGDGIAARRAPGSRELHGVLRPPPVHGGARPGRRRPRRGSADREPEVAVGGAAVRAGRDGAPDHAGRAREPEEPDRGRHLRPGGAVLPDEHQLQERARRAGGGRGRGSGKLLVGRVVRIGRGQRVRSSAERERRAGRHRRGGIRDRDDLRVRFGGSGRRLRLLRDW